ncbi:MAG: hypothetical protein Q8O40_16465 [Chloroflexota bacterium]|nr:hypothetical protein [Chloroflexota bacterium]
MSDEYNKIHAMARARDLMFQKFGGGTGTTLKLWPMADEFRAIRDLARKKPLYASKDCTVQASGVLDFAVDLGQNNGYIADFSADQGSLNYVNYQFSDSAWVKVVIPSGIWDKFDVRHYLAGNHAGYATFHVYLARDGLTPTQVESQYVEHVQQTPASSGYYTLTLNPGFPFIITSDSEWALYMKRVCSYGAPHYEGVAVDTNTNNEFTQYSWYNNQWFIGETAAWPYRRWAVLAYGQTDFDTWPSVDNFTMGVWVNADDYKAVNGVVMALSNGTEELAKIAVNSAKQPTGYFKDAGSNTYSLSGSRVLHPGFNWLTLSYQRNVANSGVKLGLNGQIVAQATSQNQPLFNQQLAVSLGVRALTTKALSSYLKGAVMDDAFAVQSVLASDDDLWKIYTAYITAAPLMLLKDVTTA